MKRIQLLNRSCKSLRLAEERGESYVLIALYFGGDDKTVGYSRQKQQRASEKAQAGSKVEPLLQRIVVGKQLDRESHQTSQGVAVHLSGQG